MAIDNTPQILASLAPLAHKDLPNGTTYNSFYVPDLGYYLLMRKSNGGIYGYYTVINELDYEQAWQEYDQQPYVVQSPSGIDFSAIVLRDALQDSINSNSAITESITDNQGEQILVATENRNTLKSIDVNTKAALTNTQLRAQPLHVSVDNPPATQAVSIASMPSTPVTGAFWPATQPVSGTVTADTGLAQPLTDTQLRAAPLPVTVTFPTTQHVTVDNPTTTVAVSNFPVTQPVSGTVTIANPAAVTDVSSLAKDATLTSGSAKTQVVNFPITQAVTGAFWQATQPVSGPATDAQLRATPLPVSGFPTTYPVTGTFWQATQPVSVTTLPLAAGASTSALQTTMAASLASMDAKLTSPLTVKNTPAITGGVSSRTSMANAVSASATVIKAGPGQLYTFSASNAGAAMAYVSLFNKATTPVSGDIPVQVYGIPGGGMANFSFPLGSTYTTGISLTVTSNVTLLGVLTGLLASNMVVVNLEYA